MSDEIIEDKVSYKIRNLGACSLQLPLSEKRAFLAGENSRSAYNLRPINQCFHRDVASGSDPLIFYAEISYINISFYFLRC